MKVTVTELTSHLSALGFDIPEARYSRSGRSTTTVDGELIEAAREYLIARGACATVKRAAKWETLLGHCASV